MVWRNLSVGSIHPAWQLGQEMPKAIRPIDRDGDLSAIIVEQHPQAILAISDNAAVQGRRTVMHFVTAGSLREQSVLPDQPLDVAR